MQQPPVPARQLGLDGSEAASAGSNAAGLGGVNADQTHSRAAREVDENQARNRQENGRGRVSLPTFVSSYVSQILRITVI